MSYQVFRLLEREEVEKVLSFVSRQAFSDGKATAKGMAQAVKNNLQVERADAEPSEADRILISALIRNQDFQGFAIPKRMTPPMFSRYDPGMEYGSHVDNAIMGGRNGEAVRSDIALTIFLSPSASYDGGELVVETDPGEEEIKLEAGEAVAYSACSIHHVNPVTRGVRLAAIAWAQSLVRDETLRAILSDLGRAAAHAEKAGDSDLAMLLGKSYRNLLRYAAEP